MEPKIIAKVETQFEAVGEDRMRRALNNLSKGYEQIRRGAATFNNATKYTDDATLKRARTIIKNGNERVKIARAEIDALDKLAQLERTKLDAAKRTTEQKRADAEALRNVQSLENQRRRGLEKMLRDEINAEKSRTTSLERQKTAGLRQMALDENRVRTKTKELSLSKHLAQLSEQYVEANQRGRGFIRGVIAAKGISETGPLSKQIEELASATQKATALKDALTIRSSQLESLRSRMAGGIPMTPERYERMARVEKAMAGEVQRLGKEYRGAAKEARQAEKGFAVANAQLTRTSPLYGFARGLEKLKTVFSRVRDALISFMVINTIVNVFQEFVRSLISSSSALEVLEARLRGLNVGAFEALKKTIIDLTIYTPFLIRDFTDAAVALQAFGLDANKYLAPVADWATAIGRDLQDVAVAFAKISAGSPRTALLLTTRGITKSEFDTERAKVQDRAVALANIIERRYTEMARKVSRTFEGMLSNIKDMWFMISTVIGKPLFDKIRVDLERLFNLLKGQREAPSKWLTGAVAALGALYDLIKGSISPLAKWAMIFGGIYAVSKLITAARWVKVLTLETISFARSIRMVGISTEATTKVVKIFGKELTAATVVMRALNAWALVLIAAWEVWSLGSSAVDELTESQERYNQAMRDSVPGQQEFNEAIAERIRIIEGSLTTWGKFKLFISNLTVMIGSLDKFFHTGRWSGGIGNIVKELELELDYLKAQLYTSKELLAVEEKRKELWLRKQGIPPLFEILGIAEDIEKKPRAKEALSKYRQAIVDALKLPTVATPLATATMEEVARFNQRMANRRVVPFLTDKERINLENSLVIINYLTKSLEELRGMADKEILGATMPKADEWMASGVEYLAHANQLGDAFKDLLGDLSDVTKGTADYSDEVAGLKERILELTEGRSKLWAKYQGLLAEEAKLAKSGAGDPNNPLSMRFKSEKVHAEYLKTVVARMEAKVDIDKASADAIDKLTEANDKYAVALREQLENTDALSVKYSNLNQAIADYNLEVNGSYEGVRKVNEALLEYIQSQMQSNNLAIEAQKKRLGGMSERQAELLSEQATLGMIRRPTQDEARKLDEARAALTAYMAEMINEETALNQLKQKGIDLEVELYDIHKKILDLPANDFWKSLVKTGAEAARQAQQIFDMFATTLHTGLAELFVETAGDIIWGTDYEDRLEDLRSQLRKIREEGNSATSSAIRRQVGELDAMYAQRVMAIETIGARQQTSLEVNEREREILEEINKLEKERNDLILNRLKTLGEKFVDVGLTQMFNFIWGKIFSLSSGGTPGFENSGSTTPTAPLTGMPSTGPGGPTYNITVTGNTFVAERDLDGLITRSLRRVEVRKSR